MLKLPHRLRLLFSHPSTLNPPLLILLILAACVCGCASPKKQLVLAPVGPAPDVSTAPGFEGTLVVYSAPDSSFDPNGSPYRDRYTPYRVLSADGREEVRTVRNDDGRLLGSPEKVQLPIGHYQVLARANGYGPVTVPVLIKAHQVTTVHLEGAHWWPRNSGILDASPVRLPRGEIVGWHTEQ